MRKQTSANWRLLGVCLVMTLSQVSMAQNKLDSLLHKIDPERLAASIKKRAEKLEEKLVEKSLKTLSKLQKEEEKLYKKMLNGKDSLLAKSKLTELQKKYSHLKEKIKNPGALSEVKNYIPKLDSLGTTLKFLNQSEAVQKALAKTTDLQNRFQQAEEIKQFIKERKEELKKQLEKLGMLKELKAINKQVYYYSAQLKEYKAIISDPKKIEKKALELLSKTKLWRDFFRKNSLFGRLFRIPDPDQTVDLSTIPGLQTRAQVTALVQQQIAAGGPNAGQQFQQNIQAAQGQLNQLKNKIIKGGARSSDAEMPEGFKPNNQKTKTFLQRLELGTNMQTQKATNFWPGTTDLALTLGYKLNDKSIIGIGGSYKLGVGRGWQDIRFSSEGMSLRSFVDWKIKKLFWLSGGFEMHYKNAFNSVEQLRQYDAWQRSGLLGITKTMPVKSKFFQKTKVQLLWDMLADQQVPRGQPIVFRIGYNFK